MPKYLINMTINVFSNYLHNLGITLSFQICLEFDLLIAITRFIVVHIVCLLLDSIKELITNHSKRRYHSAFQSSYKLAFRALPQGCLFSALAPPLGLEQTSANFLLPSFCPFKALSNALSTQRAALSVASHPILGMHFIIPPFRVL